MVREVFKMYHVKFQVVAHYGRTLMYIAVHCSKYVPIVNRYLSHDRRKVVFAKDGRVVDTGIWW